MPVEVHLINPRNNFALLHLHCNYYPNLNPQKAPSHTMPPLRSRPQPEDSRSEASSTKEKVHATTATTANSKRRAGGNATIGSSLRDVVTAGQITAVSGSAAANSEISPGVSILQDARVVGS